MIIRFLAFAAAALLAVPLTATAQARPDRATLGAVESTYVKIAPGVFMDVRLARHREPAETWSDVRMGGNSAGSARSEIARNPDGMKVAKGDVVEVAVAILPEYATGPLPETTRITHRVAPAGSALARQFEESLRPALKLAKRFDDAAQSPFLPHRQNGF